MTNYDEAIKLYASGLSALQVREKLNLTVSIRQIQRELAKRGYMRPRKLAYEMAVKQGRLGPKIRRPKISALKLPPMLRMMIFKRDNFRCQICGISAKENGILEIDHIDFDIRNNDPFNLQILCYECNIGKRKNQS